jgi:site-specific recombinase XerD
VTEAGKRAGLAFPISSHMLRHSAGYALSTAGMDMRVLQGYLGHVNVQHTSRYIALDPSRFRGFWQD